MLQFRFLERRPDQNVGIAMLYSPIQHDHSLPSHIVGGWEGVGTLIRHQPFTNEPDLAVGPNPVNLTTFPGIAITKFPAHMRTEWLNGCNRDSCQGNPFG